MSPTSPPTLPNVQAVPAQDEVRPGLFACKLVRAIGKGAHGLVHRATFNSMPVAIKQPLIGSCSEADVQRNYAAWLVDSAPRTPDVTVWGEEDALLPLRPLLHQPRHARAPPRPHSLRQARSRGCRCTEREHPPAFQSEAKSNGAIQAPRALARVPLLFRNCAGPKPETGRIWCHLQR